VAFPTGQSDDDLPRVAMVVAAWNEASVLRQKLENTWAIDYPAHLLTLVIGSDGSDDETAAILEACGDRRLQAHCFAERRGKISVLNDLMSRVDAEIVVMSDANTMFAPDAVRLLVRRFQDPAVGCVSGELGLERDGGVSGEGLYWRYENWIKRQESRMGFLIGCNGGIFAIRRELYTPLPPNTLVEDFVLTMRILERGARVEFEPEARATEPACPSARAEMIRKARIGAGGFQAMGMTRALLNPLRGMPAFAYWGHKVLRWFVPLFLMVTLVCNLLLLDQPLYVVILGAQVVGVFIACWAYLARPGAEPPRWTRPVSYFYLMNYALFCGFIRFLLGTQRVTWKRAFS
jgi:cellulose synthase/poly-beta-1,6-N-acetylglucosamine synthase-like glycosyltransferase